MVRVDERGAFGNHKKTRAFISNSLGAQCSDIDLVIVEKKEQEYKKRIQALPPLGQREYEIRSWACA